MTYVTRSDFGFQRSVVERMGNVELGLTFAVGISNGPIAGYC